jgi:hypothetical protein
MNITQHQKIVEAINKKVGDRKLECPISGHTDSWGVNISSASLPAVDVPGAYAVPGGPVFPVAVVVCQECGYTFFMNLVQLGLAEELGITALPDE